LSDSSKETKGTEYRQVTAQVIDTQIKHAQIQVSLPYAPFKTKKKELKLKY